MKKKVPVIIVKSEESITKSQLKAKYKNFWTSWRWIPGRSPEVWVDIMAKSFMSKDIMNNTLKQALVKLNLEKKITREQVIELGKMLDSDDRESQYLAVSIMQEIAPKRFLRRNKEPKVESEPYNHVSNIIKRNY